MRVEQKPSKIELEWFDENDESRAELQKQLGLRKRGVTSEPPTAAGSSSSQERHAEFRRGRWCYPIQADGLKIYKSQGGEVIHLQPDCRGLQKAIRKIDQFRVCKLCDDEKRKWALVSERPGDE